ncbi:D-alanine--D-alanine ligase family protein [Phytomonospora endophytica]|uniref:D-alanine--D-alanine ligase n=1 Tax=Phytomonospora endophytica TaxID=714109 RepID=A0A841FSY1_9ACTN|nr:D-alanine--D-alanine ligase family protein [Phytomonospora endophytica]MBB6038914.1 D-alanine-D-alanine ligase [Phytomonospora endophytica]GIG67984.1 D-alanine--D-alanine ligase [Phytomonospora endophytica]
MSAVRVGVLFGGPSAEHTVSAASALGVARALPRERFTPVVIGVGKDGSFHLLPEEQVTAFLNQTGATLAIEDRLEVGGPVVELRSARPRTGVHIVLDGEVVETVDVFFPVLHGPFGEDGVLQGLLESLGAPYAGCGVAASAVGMDKVAMKRAFKAEGIPVTPYVWVDETRFNASADPAEFVEGLELPLFVKPANMGSSIGISRVDELSELSEAVKAALAFDPVVIIEQGVRNARELEAGVLGGFEPRVSVVGEVTVAEGVFDFDQKYLGTSDPMIVPADLPEEVAAEIRELSLRAFRSIGGWGLARVDFLYDAEAGQIYVNELNTLPGFTAHSMYPKVWAPLGITYAQLTAELVDLAFERHELYARKRSAS